MTSPRGPRSKSRPDPGTGSLRSEAAVTERRVSEGAAAPVGVGWAALRGAARRVLPTTSAAAARSPYPSRPGLRPEPPPQTHAERTGRGPAPLPASRSPPGCGSGGRAGAVAARGETWDVDREARGRARGAGPEGALGPRQKRRASQGHPGPPTPNAARAGEDGAQAGGTLVGPARRGLGNLRPGSESRPATRGCVPRASVPSSGTREDAAPLAAPPGATGEGPGQRGGLRSGQR